MGSEDVTAVVRSGSAIADDMLAEAGEVDGAEPSGGLKQSQRPALPSSEGFVRRVPRHVAIIMDGNRRWAEARGLPVALGHRAGADAARRAIEAAVRAEVRWLTLFAFSSENWKRPAVEVQELTALLRHYLRAEVDQLVKEGIRLRVIGERDRFGPATRAAIMAAETRTQGGQRLNLTLALSYGGRGEMLAATRALAQACLRGELSPSAIDEAAFAARLFTAGMPDPELVIRTSGEQRLSNFLLWQTARAELLFQPILWPDFGKEEFNAALEAFAALQPRKMKRPL